MPPRRRTHDQMPAEHALLGLLAQAESSRHGYDLAREFAPGSELGEVIRLEPGMLYHHLKKLERDGWVLSRQEVVDRRPARSVYSLTASGQAELERWMTEPVGHTREIRLEFLVKLYLALKTDPELARRLISEQIATLEEIEAERLATAPGEDFSSAVRALRVAQTRTALDWLRSLKVPD
ncbi:MAG: PadR family transcriptional regulator [Chloroflexota bacterium]|jgi:PadR family transcriptional regulator AphA|nr:PadR family transcriptional regulator [Chloroflexota bacterium]